VQFGQARAVTPAPPFHSLFPGGHLATIAGNFWPRPVSEERWPVTDVLYEPEPQATVLVREQRPERAHGEVILVHGLEGSSESGYMRSMAYALLEAGFAVHRYNMRGCGGSPWHAKANYHSGQSGDVLFVARQLKQKYQSPVFAVGFSLGGNMVLKMAGELGERGRDVVEAVISACAPIDLAASVHQIGAKQNIFYERRFVARLKDRVRRRNPVAPDLFPLEHLPKVNSIWDFDDYYTSRIFGFGSAANYYRTQSSNQFLDRVRVPTLVIHAKDDPMIPAASYQHPAFAANPHLQLWSVERGGHLGFLARGAKRFWLDAVIAAWVNQTRLLGTNARVGTYFTNK